MDRNDVSLDDFMTGLIAGLAKLGVDVVSIRENLFYKAVIDAFEVFKTEAQIAGVSPRFRLRLNRVYGDSPDIRDALTRAVQRDLVSLDNPEYLDVRLKISRGDADLYLERLAGNADMYLDAAREFRAAYPSYV